MRRSKYHRLKGCDCPSCSTMTGLWAWLEYPPGAWSTLLLIAVIVVVIAAYCFFRPETTITATALKG